MRYKSLQQMQCDDNFQLLLITPKEEAENLGIA